MHATLPLLQGTDFPFITRHRLQTLQVNLGYRCNQSCVHCHVNAGPKRTEEMDSDTADVVLQYLETSGAKIFLWQSTSCRRSLGPGEFGC